MDWLRDNWQEVATAGTTLTAAIFAILRKLRPPVTRPSLFRRWLRYLAAVKEYEYWKADADYQRQMRETDQGDLQQCRTMLGMAELTIAELRTALANATGSHGGSGPKSSHSEDGQSPKPSSTGSKNASSY